MSSANQSVAPGQPGGRRLYELAGHTLQQNTACLAVSISIGGRDTST